MTDFRIEQFPFTANTPVELSLFDSYLSNWPIVYTLSNESEIYIGETGNASSRISQHLGSLSKQKLKLVQIFLNEKFNKSASLDLESQLIRLFAADEKFKVLNSNLGISDADYFERSSYAKSFDALFEQLTDAGWFTKSVPDLINSNLFKYSPFKSLTQEQAQAVKGIFETILLSRKQGESAKVVIEGQPGTGKTIVAIYLIKLLRDLNALNASDDVPEDSVFAELLTQENREVLANFRVGIVIPQQALRQTLTKVFSKTPGLEKSMILSPFQVGQSQEKWDLLLVDETHRLGIRAQQPHPTLNTKFANINRALFGQDDLSYTQLDWVNLQSENQVLLVDPEQSIKPADLPRNVIDQLIESAKQKKSYFKLMSQLRVEGGEDYIKFIRSLFTENPLKSSGFGSYELRFFDSLAEMRDEIVLRERKFGLSRLLAGFAWPWVSKKQKDTPDIKIGDVELFWNRTDKDWISSLSSDEEVGVEVGSIHTIQGYDLNYAGVIIGEDLYFDKSAQRVRFNRDKYFDANGKVNNLRLGITYSDDDVLIWVLNIYCVLLTRGIKGTFVYVVDPYLREHLSKYF